ncbi:uncharacterized protein LOC123266558 [Cotesia glomerata]|uniref:uncharacterized protein LOC123266558 n=1 Tax=Cotesia glomerata TaxID=32391 RepID=UPI001D008E13|nr:uncharacterized protein LOC123266558 [Cotesia glomerata]XP_044586798.1 uncharacterized protein LOC123266558 [Cotesia glomerata]
MVTYIYTYILKGRFDFKVTCLSVHNASNSCLLLKPTATYNSYRYRYRYGRRDNENGEKKLRRRRRTVINVRRATLAIGMKECGKKYFFFYFFFFETRTNNLEEFHERREERHKKALVKVMVLKVAPSKEEMKILTNMRKRPNSIRRSGV